MTIASQTSRISYVGDGVTTAFPVPFYFAANADLVVYLQDSSGNQTLQVLGTHYSLTGATLSAGGACTFVTAPTATTGAVVTIYRDPAATQTTSYNNNDPFPAKSHELALDKLTTLVQRCKDLVMRAIHQSEGEAAMTTALAAPAVRKNKLLGFGSSGELIYPLGPTYVAGTFNGVAEVDSRATAQVTAFPISINAVKTSGYATAGDGGGATYKRGAGSGSFSDAGAVTWSLDLAGGIVNPRCFGAIGDGVTDDTAALQAALTAALGGKQLYIPPGTWGVSATLVGGTGNVRVFGAGKNRSVLKVLGSNAVDPVLRFTDANDVTVEGLEFRGNAVSVDIGAIQFLLTVAAAAVIGNYNVIGNYFTNFKAHYWIRFLTHISGVSNTQKMRYIRVLNNTWVAATDLAVDFTVIGQASMMLAIQGSLENAASYLDEIIVAGNFADCTGVKGFLNCWSGTHNLIAHSNYILNAGALGVDNCACYGILAYNNGVDHTYAPQDVKLIDNTIISARSCGIYAADVVRLDASRNKVSGVVDLTAGSLPYAAISLGQCEDSRANFNDLRDNYVGLQLIPTPTSLTIEAVGNSIYSAVANAIGIQSTLVGSFTTKTRIVDNTIRVTHAGAGGILSYSVGVGYEHDTLEIINNRVTSGGTGIGCYDSTGGGVLGNALIVRGNNIDGTLSVVALDFAAASTIKTSVEGGFIDLANAGASCIGFRFTSHANIHIDGMTIANRTTGAALAYSALNANGSLRNLNLATVARANLPASGSAHLGFNTPGGTPVGIGLFVQNLAPTVYTAQGAAASQYTNDGWTTDGTNWLQRRCLTGT